ncbi:MAG: non-ribosomal peptide synthetase, partial [Deltaproteobacteria bacterium]|nr:non-ribosomal peptide synthetase [Deltaproteobacteria bacterium]
AFSGAGAFAGTPILPLYYRLMGARIGKGCTLDTAACSIFDLVTIGDDTSIGADSQLLGYRVEDGELVLGRIDLGSRCFVGIHSVLGLNVAMRNGARLDDQSLLPDGETIGVGESRRGSPAQAADVAVPAAREGGRRRPVLFGLIHFFAAEVLAIAMVVPGFAMLGLYYVAYLANGFTGVVAALVASVPVGVVVYSRGIKPGVFDVESSAYVRKWLSDELMKLARVALKPLYTTIYFPSWLRLLGARIDARAELSTVWNFSPELIEVGEESFFADGSIVGGKRFYGGRFEIAFNRIGRRSFVGNSAVVPVGASLGDGCLLGVQSLPPADSKCTPDGTEWLGSPAFRLPHRVKVGNFDASVTFKPTRKLYVQRALIDALRIVIPGYIGLSAAAVGVTATYLVLTRFGLAAMFASLPLTALALGLYAMLCVAALKKLVMGTFKPVIVPLWSMYVWLNEMVNGAYESVMAPALAPYLGTPLAAPLLRLVGCRIGKRTFLETTLFSEFDLVEIGDYAALNAGAIVQNHLFEDRVMKSDALKIGESCTVGNLAVVLYNTEMAPASSLGPLSLLMKGETLSAGGAYHGIPTTRAARSPLALEFHASPPAKRQASRRRRLLPLAASLGTGVTP